MAGYGQAHIHVSIVLSRSYVLSASSCPHRTYDKEKTYVEVNYGANSHDPAPAKRGALIRKFHGSSRIVVHHVKSQLLVYDVAYGLACEPSC